MVFPPSKPADRYNMEIAALMKFGRVEAFGYDLKNASVSMYPDPILEDMSLIGVKISFDIIASSSHWEVFVECKYAEEPKPISINSSAFKQSLAECLAADPLSKAGNKDYKFIFVCNGDTNSLVQEINELRTASDDTLNDYLDKVRTAAMRKWSGSNPTVENISLKHLRKYLIELRIMTVDNGTLSSMRVNADYIEVCRQIYFERPSPSQVEDNSSVPRSIILKYLGDDFRTTRWKGGTVYLSDSFLKWLMSHRLANTELVKEIAFEDIPSFESIKYRFPPNVIPETADESLTVCANIELSAYGSNYVALLAMSKKRVYLINRDQFFEKTFALSEMDYSIKLDKIKKNLDLPIGGTFLKLAIQEVYRSKGMILSEEHLRD